LVPQCIHHSVHQGFALAIGCCGGDDEIIGERSQASDIQQQDILRLLVIQNVDDVVGEFQGVQGYYLRGAG
jgi:hypothetical protein